MEFSWLVNDNVVLAFKDRYNIAQDVLIKHYPQGNIEDQRVPR